MLNSAQVSKVFYKMHFSYWLKQTNKIQIYYKTILSHPDSPPNVINKTLNERERRDVTVTKFILPINRNCTLSLLLFLHCLAI